MKYLFRGESVFDRVRRTGFMGKVGISGEHPQIVRKPADESGPADESVEKALRVMRNQDEREKGLK